MAAHSLYDVADSGKFELQGARGNAYLTTSTRFVFDLRHQAQNWIRSQSSNHGLLLRTTNRSEFSSFDLFAFYNQTAQDSTKRPQLIVKYTVESN